MCCLEVRMRNRDISQYHTISNGCFLLDTIIAQANNRDIIEIPVYRATLDGREDSTLSHTIRYRKFCGILLIPGHTNTMMQ